MIEPIITRVAHTGADELRFRGKKVFAELLGTATTAQMLVLGVSGRMLAPDEAAIIDDIVTVMSSADPRMWPFKIVRLAAAGGSAAHGVATTLIAAEGGVFGPNRMRAAATWLLELNRQSPGGLDDAQIVGALQNSGGAFGVLYRSRDERFAALMQQVVRRGRHGLPYTRLCLRAVELARTQRQLEPHVFLGVAALALDLGLDVDAVSSLATLLLFHDGLANAVEGASQRTAVLRELPRHTVNYQGPIARVSERARSR